MQSLNLSDVLSKIDNFKISVDSCEIWLTGIVTGDRTVELNPPHTNECDSNNPSIDIGSDNDESNKSSWKSGSLSIGWIDFIVVGVVAVFVIIKRY